MKLQLISLIAGHGALLSGKEGKNPPVIYNREKSNADAWLYTVRCGCI
jgi:hypothetical protein